MEFYFLFVLVVFGAGCASGANETVPGNLPNSLYTPAANSSEVLSDALEEFIKQLLKLDPKTGAEVVHQSILDDFNRANSTRKRSIQIPILDQHQAFDQGGRGRGRVSRDLLGGVLGGGGVGNGGLHSVRHSGAGGKVGGGVGGGDGLAVLIPRNADATALLGITGLKGIPKQITLTVVQVNNLLASLGLARTLFLMDSSLLLELSGCFAYCDGNQACLTAAQACDPASLGYIGCLEEAGNLVGQSYTEEYGGGSGSSYGASGIDSYGYGGAATTSSAGYSSGHGQQYAGGVSGAGYSSYGGGGVGYSYPYPTPAIFYPQQQGYYGPYSTSYYPPQYQGTGYGPYSYGQPAYFPQSTYPSSAAYPTQYHSSYYPSSTSYPDHTHEASLDYTPAYHPSAHHSSGSGYSHGSSQSTTGDYAPTHAEGSYSTTHDTTSHHNEAEITSPEHASTSYSSADQHKRAVRIPRMMNPYPQQQQQTFQRYFRTNY